MGNTVSATVSGGGGGKIVLPDGRVRALGMGETVSVAKLMVEHPRHFVVDARLLAATTTTGGGSGAKKVAALPTDHILVGAGVYVVLPATRGRVSADEARGRALLASSRPLVRSMPTDARGQRDEEAARLGRLGDHQPRSELLSRELSCRGSWKPSLKTIEERALPRKVPHWLF